MPANPANVSVAVQAPFPRDVQAGQPVALALDSSYATANDPKKYFNPKAAQADHGTATKIGIAAGTLFKTGGRSLVALKPTITAVASEDKGDVPSGTLLNFPVTNSTALSVTVGGTGKTVVGTTESPIAATAAAGTVLVNFFTGAFKKVAGEAGAVVFNYSYIGFTAAKNSLKSAFDSLGPYELFFFPNYPLNLKSYGDYRAWVEICDDEAWVEFSTLTNADTVASGKALRLAINNKHLFIAAHKESTKDTVAALVGTVSRVDPWVTAAFKPIREISPAYYLPTEIGDVATADTFEGEGINVIHRIGNANVLTNERTAVAYTDVSEEIYLSRVRLRCNLQARLQVAINALLVTNPKIGFNETGIASCSATIQKVLENLVAQGAITRDYTITEPVLSNISTADKKARKLGTFEVRVKMVESAHEVVVEVAMEVA